MTEFNWPPDYTKIFAQRQRWYLRIKDDPRLIAGAKAYYADNPHDFVNHWCITYDPRNALNGVTTMPFITFPRQNDMIDFLLDCLNSRECGLIEKSRDAGATYISCAFSVWLWVFMRGVSIGWGSRKESLVDKLGDPDSIFEKMRIIINGIPRFFWPRGFTPKEHMNYMRIQNPETGSTITGETGDNIGRGGRKTIYFKDESAHYERPELIEAALSQNTECQVDISSVNGTGTVFARKRQAGVEWEKCKDIDPGYTRIFVFDWRDDPRKDQDWYDKERDKAQREGLMHLFAQEVDRDYAAAVDGVLIPSEWVRASIDAHIKLGFTDEGMPTCGLDVADEGGDKNAFVIRKGVIVTYCESWASSDPGEAARKAIVLMKRFGSRDLQYDCIGVGATVKAEVNRMGKKGLLDNMNFSPWNAAASPLKKTQRLIKGDSSSPRIGDYFSNLKAQGWWELRRRFEKTYKTIVEGEKYCPTELVSISSKIRIRHELEKELSQPTYSTNGKGQIVVDKKPKGAKSPDLADALMMCFWPVHPVRVLI